ncbi:MAG: RagB/SusD family nutrient uptake outer membrane protein [Paludibacteraceae bacterium]|nr:RagB/SusD family nutrient uptake outer membrane protein [Paludibacteraceae bacterium]
MKAKYIFCGVLALLLASCEKDFFSTNSPSAMDVSVFKSAEMTEQAVTAIYNTFGEDKSFRNRLCGGYVAMNTDIEYCNKSGGQAREAATYALSKGTGDLSTSNGKDPWAYLNSAIERCNVVIDGICAYSDTTDATFRYLLGETLTLRAFCYLEMVKLWGDVPACFSSFDGNHIEDLYIKKTDRNVIYEQLRSDLRWAADLMPWSAGCPGKAANFTGRASKALALGLLARMDLMYAGLAMRPDVFTEGGTSACSVQYNVKDAAMRQELYQEVVWACAQIIKQEDSKLQSSFEQIWRDFCADVTDYNQSEFIWALPFLDGARGQVLALTGLKISTNAPEALINVHWDKSGSTSNGKVQGMIMVTPTFYFAYDTKDMRRDVTICPFQWEYDNGSGTSSEPSAFPGATTSEKKLYQKNGDASSMYLGKLRPEWMVREYSSNEDCVDMPVLRYADILLMFAEAAIGSKEGNAPTDLYGLDPQEQFDKVRTRAGLDSKTLTFDAIVDERAFEFCGENIRKYDLMRWGLLKERLENTMADLAALQDGTGKYAGRCDSIYFKFRQDDQYSKKGHAYVIDTIVGLRLGDVRPADFDKTNGWIVKAFYTKTDDKGVETKQLDPKDYYLYQEGTDIDMHQYWPIFEVNINASNGTLWNDYLY